VTSLSADTPRTRERRFGEEEVRRILELATRTDHGDVPTSQTGQGLTLAEIQSIGVEVGVPPEVVARAAAALAEPNSNPPRTSWGMPIEVRRTIPLPRALSDAEWDRVVAELRSTFRARGKITAMGGLREWSNGNLHACVEPTDNGHRLRIGTLKGDASGINALGATGIAAASLLAGLTAFAGATPDLAGPLMLGLAGAGALVANLVRLPRWARERNRQMAQIENSVRHIVAADPAQ
jgi:hypothetical protein